MPRELKGTYSAVDFVKSDYDQALFTDNVHTDNLMTAVLNLAAETWVVRRRLMIAEQLAAQKTFATAEAIDAFKPSEAQKKAWEEERDIFIQATLGVLTRPARKLEGAQVPMSRSATPLRNV